MRSFEILEHTADVGLRAWGDSLAELLVACAEGMFSILVAGSDVAERAELDIELEAEDAEELVHLWLRELLFRFDAEGFLPARFELHEATPTRLHATCRGESFDPARHRGGTEVKAVTRHDFTVQHGPGGWTAEVLLDV